jgi:hypothetical protein
MESVWKTTCRYGIFPIFIHQLLLWRRQDDDNDARITSNDAVYRSQLPSWSWMVCSYIKFPGDNDLQVPRHEELCMDPKQPRSLCVLVRSMQNCEPHQKGSLFKITNMDGQDVGTFWPDEVATFPPLNCIVVAMEERDYMAADSEKTYYVLFVKDQPEKDSFMRIGAGTILAQYVSTHAQPGRLL